MAAPFRLSERASACLGQQISTLDQYLMSQASGSGCATPANAPASHGASAIWRRRGMGIVASTVCKMAPTDSLAFRSLFSLLLWLFCVIEKKAWSTFGGNSLPIELFIVIGGGS